MYVQPHASASAVFVVILDYDRSIAKAGFFLSESTATCLQPTNCNLACDGLLTTTKTN